jgi:hypothetical protein
MSLKERFEEVQENINNYDRTEAVENLKSIASDYGQEREVDSFIHTDDVDDFVERRFQSGGWQGVACCLTDLIHNQSDDYYNIDGYENLELVTVDLLQNTLDDLKRALSDELEEEEEEELD